eukprot:PhM_4_TR17222/c0_g1_i1/m.39684
MRRSDTCHATVVGNKYVHTHRCSARRQPLGDNETKQFQEEEQRHNRIRELLLFQRGEHTKEGEDVKEDDDHHNHLVELGRLIEEEQLRCLGVGSIVLPLTSLTFESTKEEFRCSFFVNRVVAHVLSESKLSPFGLSANERRYLTGVVRNSNRTSSDVLCYSMLPTLCEYAHYLEAFTSLGNNKKAKNNFIETVVPRVSFPSTREQELFMSAVPSSPLFSPDRRHTKHTHQKETKRRVFDVTQKHTEIESSDGPPTVRPSPRPPSSRCNTAAMTPKAKRPAPTTNSTLRLVRSIPEFSATLARSSTKGTISNSTAAAARRRHLQRPLPAMRSNFDITFENEKPYSYSPRPPGSRTRTTAASLKNTTLGLSLYFIHRSQDLNEEVRKARIMSPTTESVIV